MLQHHAGVIAETFPDACSAAPFCHYFIPDNIC